MLTSAIRCDSAIRETHFHTTTRLGFSAFSFRMQPNPKRCFVSDYQTRPVFYTSAPDTPAPPVGVAAGSLDRRRRSWRDTPTHRGLMRSRCRCAMPRPTASRSARRAAASRSPRLCGDVFLLLFQPTDHAPFDMWLLLIRRRSTRLLLMENDVAVQSIRAGVAQQESEREAAPPSGRQSSLSSLFPYFHHKAHSLKKRKKII